jgi:hypothetical protein
MASACCSYDPEFGGFALLSARVRVPGTKRKKQIITSQCAFNLTAFRGIVKIVVERSSRFGLVQYIPHTGIRRSQNCA